MLNEKDLYNGFQKIDDDILERSEVIIKKNKKLKWIAVAACLAVVVSLGIFALVRNANSGNSEQDIMLAMHKRYENVSFSGHDSFWLINWPSKYEAVYEHFREVTYNGKKYETKCSKVEMHSAFVSSIDESWLGDVIGTCESSYEYYIDSERIIDERTFEVRKIQWIPSDLLIAVEMEGKFYVFEYEKAQYGGHNTLGEIIEAYNLSETMDITSFYEYRMNPMFYERERKYYGLQEDAYIWEVLLACADAQKKQKDSDDDSETREITFIANTEVFGERTKSLSVTSDGYVSILGTTFFIGEEASNKIISYADKNSTKMKEYVNSYWIVGQLTTIGEDYIWVDDSVACSFWEKGKSYKISTDDIRLRRYIELGYIQKGDLFAISFTGSGNMETGEFEIGQYCSVNPSVVVSKNGEILILE